MKLMFWRVLGWLGDTWRSLYLNGRQRNHRLVGFYRYHFDTMRAKVSPRFLQLKQLTKTPKFDATLRVMLFWPLMVVAAFILYTEQVPLFTPSIGLNSGQGSSSPQVGYQSALNLQADSNGVNQFSTVQPFSFSARTGLVQSTGAGNLAATDNTDAGNKASSTQEELTVPNTAEQPVTTKEDEVAAVLASLPHFEVAEIKRPIQGDVVRSMGWYRHEVYGDWRMASGLTIEPTELGASVQAAFTGVVDQVTKLEANTWSVKLLHQEGWESEYSGLEQITVEPGSVIKQGEALGTTTDDAQATVSFTLKHDDKPIDTIEYWN